MLRLWRKANGKQLATTIVEMAVSASLISIVGITVAFVTLHAARASRDGYQFMRTESNARAAADLVRRQALVGEFLTARVRNNGHTLEFHDPWTKTRPYFAYTEGTLRYFPDEGAAPQYIIGGLSNVDFSLHRGQRILRFEVSTTTTNYRGQERTMTLTDEILLRNRPDPTTLF
jgi:hypothetical protein